MTDLPVTLITRNYAYVRALGPRPGSNDVAAAGKRLTGYEPTPWAPEVWDIHNWRTV